MERRLIKQNRPSELDQFRSLRRLTNHWSRPGGGPENRQYYWYLTFAAANNLRTLAQACQQEVAFPYYDLVPLDKLHMTVDRVAIERQVESADLDAIIAEAAIACRQIDAFSIAVGRLSGTPGALGFNVSPYDPVRHLHDRLKDATQRAYPAAPVKDREFHAHIAIAYGNSDVPSADAQLVVERLNPLPEVEVYVDNAALVLVERRQNSYDWNVIQRIPLGRN